MKAFGVVAALVAAVVAGGLARNAVYAVGQDRQAVVLRLGAPERVVGAGPNDRVGLALKWPFVERAVMYDRRSQPLAIGGAEIATAGPAPVEAEAILDYRVVDPLQFYRTLGAPRQAAPRLRALVLASLRRAFGAATAQDILSDRRAQVLQAAQADLAATAKARRLGIVVVDLQLGRLGPTPAGAEAVFRRMIAADQQQADQIRADAEVNKRTLMAEADKDAAVIRGTANGQAQQIRGEGDAKRAAIFNAAYGQDPQFAAFLRTMQAYRDSLGQGDTTFVLTADSPFLRDLKTGTGGH